MLLPVPHRRQSQSKNCLPACVQMVLEYQGVIFSESDLEAMLQTEPLGTRLSNVEFLNVLPQVEKITLTPEQLEASLTDGFR